ncbi:HAD family phosphatase [Niveibacterium umoris]|uniref:HAD superfamily hydrolase (TIGR01509 family) n=1 Tax=Niveibacterium umoris TaxID=1193620 RepID=A0A840BVI5_9RHOO|nr:HAD family phosphatase [Niveibacterium umoris]MBB4014327.1 HAD superfamily hydrolase (TIGR01509 family) [Niveibacterium umoris]
MTILAVIFDMDGLLLDSERIAFGIGRDACTALGLPWREETALAMIGRNARDNAQLLEALFGHADHVEAHSAEFARRYEAVIAAGEIPLKPGVTELLDRLDALALPRAVATSTSHGRALFKLECCGIAHRMHAVVGGDQVAHGKPAPDIFLAAAERLGVAPANCLALEDSNAGARAALAAGMQVRVVPDLLPPDADVLASGAQVIPSLFAIVEELS